MAAVPGHAVQVTSATPGVGGAKGVVRQPSRDELDEADQECLKRFLKMPVRRFVDHVENDGDEQVSRLLGLVRLPKIIYYK